ncbi:aldo/keto reductase family protein [Brucella pseudogrignonensis]|uniref:Aldo/keto reductase family protein n=1 Tax=Brucella pseudogrignonensis TaxID=419475 RepID=A0A256G907_9HYPH|nr:aldo/keto reductase family protein [Brucella pseudogrignonensis]
MALSWLLRRSPNILLIPGTASRLHLRENLSARSIELQYALSELDALSAQPGAAQQN